MVDYKKFLKKSEEERPTNPIEIFNRLPVKALLNDLYQSQRDVLSEWFKRREENDLVVKLHTGGGKTLVGMLIGMSIMNETKKGVLYLVPNRQLQNQAITKAINYGVPAISYGEDALDTIPDEFLRGKKILVGTYKSLFNAKSRFGILGGNKEIVEVGGIIVDDAHSSFPVIRESFSLRIQKGQNEAAYKEIIDLFWNDFRVIGKQETLNDILRGEDNGILEIPYWSWDKRFKEARTILESVKNTFSFVWALVRDRLRESHALIGRDGITITPIYPPVRMIPTFSDCPRRVYMSATLNDDSPIIENFDAKIESVKSPITAKTLAGIGERMIIIPGLTRLPDPDRVVKKMLSDFSGKKFGVVVLVPSGQSAKQWQNIGAVYADSSEKVDEFVGLLVDRKSDGPYVFANRYDGIDLPGDSCRILIIDGIPLQSGEYEKYQERVLTGSTFLSGLVGVRIEQGIGRASRGRGDYSVVLLTGKSLSAWISKNYDAMTVGTRSQIKIAFDTTKDIATVRELEATINQCLDRDQSWVEYHAQELAKLTELPKAEAKKLEAVSIMRDAFNLADDGQYDRAVAKLNSIDSGVENNLRGIAKELQARFSYFWGELSDSEGYQRDAFGLNRHLLRPNTAPPYYQIPSKYEQTRALVDQLVKYRFRRGFLDEFEETVKHLDGESSSSNFEESLKSLAGFIGLRAERPEKERHEGPDVLWILPENSALVIEVKSMKKPENKFVKRDMGQLLTSFEWFKEKYLDVKGIPISVHANDNAESRLATGNVKVLTLGKIIELISELRAFLIEICRDDLSDEYLVKTCEESLKKHRLLHTDLIRIYLQQFKKV